MTHPFDSNRASELPRAVPAYYRHPLGLPEGSIRSLMTLMVLGIVWTLLLLPKDRDVHIPVYLYYLMFLMLGHYFAARGQAPKVKGRGGASPLYLPRGTIRFLIVLGFVGVLGWGYYSNPNFLERLKPLPEEIAEQPLLPIVLLGAFFLGVIVERAAQVLLHGPQGMPGWYQDVKAWLSLLAIMGLAAEVIIQLVLAPTVDWAAGWNLPHWQMILTGVVAFYFGTRS
ncbi:MAG: hypothetical protein NZ700_05065 [Gemmataceae bacterium]|nr:hypothetical protein [Gemmataceae bacterium]MDW8266449.1 hypothetical protein [Gemmataceae bacterium]